MLSSLNSFAVRLSTANNDCFGSAESSSGPRFAVGCRGTVSGFSSAPVRPRSTSVMAVSLLSHDFPRAGPANHPGHRVRSIVFGHGHQRLVAPFDLHRGRGFDAGGLPERQVAAEV